MLMFKEFLRKLFSDNCQLTSLKLDVSTDDFYANIHQCFSLINNELGMHCMSLRYLHIHLIYGFLFEHIIEHAPNLEILSIHFKNSLVREWSYYRSEIKAFVPTYVNWYNKVKKEFSECCFVREILVFC